jgi:hypothetical protein
MFPLNIAYTEKDAFKKRRRVFEVLGAKPL